MGMLVTFPVCGRVSDGLFPINVKRISTFGVFFADALVRYFMRKVSKYDTYVYDSASDGEMLFHLVEHSSVVLRPLVHPKYHTSLKRLLFYLDGSFYLNHMI